ncbi:60S ribosomal protein L19 [Astathelohania contejeani]|uniref:60S ribosomal protein L19 n=1 Tax=Astathelohania contejeani TaxID=164912 RepID=A0ABQ7HXQ1_9MICR|nr:60S ribosomal protein L19 [Thelohania contejeani]
MDPNEYMRFKSANTRENVRALMKDGYILRKPDTIRSRFRAKQRAIAKAKGRHCGPGKRKGTANARCNFKKVWMARIRAQRKTLREMREKKEITPAEHKAYYLKVKGNTYRSVRMLCEAIEKKKESERRMKDLADQAAALNMDN